MWFTKSQILKCDRAQKTSNRTRTPSRMVSNGAYMPVLQSSEQKAVEEKIVRMADANSKRLGMTRRDYAPTKQRSMRGAAESMTLRHAAIDAHGNLFDEAELDNSVCECCQTSAAVTSQGPIAVYRDRSPTEMRWLLAA